MKRFLCLIFAAMLLLCGCEKIKEEPTQYDTAAHTVGAWITAFELSSMLEGKEGFEQEFSNALDILEGFGVNCIYVHVRAFADAYYRSSLFPLAAALDQDIDPLEIMLTQAKKRGMKFFAWINPYRISSSSNDKTTVNEKIVKAVGQESILATDSGIYLDPASYCARRLVIDGVREVLKNYSIDGIHFDDYFYPTADPAFDEASYTAYKSKTNTPLPIDAWRRANVNTLISGTYAAIKALKSEALFSISPTADIQGNYSNLFADVRAWCDGQYVDEIIPQLYFGFEYPDKKFRFDTLLDTWNEYLKGTDVRVLIGLPCYKKNTNEGADRQEWSTNDDIISRQIQCIKEKSPNAGYVYFSYSSLK